MEKGGGGREEEEEEGRKKERKKKKKTKRKEKGTTFVRDLTKLRDSPFISHSYLFKHFVNIVLEGTLNISG